MAFTCLEFISQQTKIQEIIYKHIVILSSDFFSVFLYAYVNACMHACMHTGVLSYVCKHTLGYEQDSENIFCYRF